MPSGCPAQGELSRDGVAAIRVNVYLYDDQRTGATTRHNAAGHVAGSCRRREASRHRAVAQKRHAFGAADELLQAALRIQWIVARRQAGAVEFHCNEVAVYKLAARTYQSSSAAPAAIPPPPAAACRCRRARAPCTCTSATPHPSTVPWCTAALWRHRPSTTRTRPSNRYRIFCSPCPRSRILHPRFSSLSGSTHTAAVNILVARHGGVGLGIEELADGTELEGGMTIVATNVLARAQLRRMLEEAVRVRTV